MSEKKNGGEKSLNIHSSWVMERNRSLLIIDGGPEAEKFNIVHFLHEKTAHTVSINMLA